VTPPLLVRAIDAATHRAYLKERAAQGQSASFLQTPGWATVKHEWRPESIGWYDGERLVGVGLVLYRQLPRLKRYLAYLPEGPIIDWTGELEPWLRPLAEHLSRAGAFAIRMGPPVVVRRWSATQVKEGIANPATRLLGRLAPSSRELTGASVLSQLREAGWSPQSVEGGFAAGQPQFNFVIVLEGRTEAEVLAGMNQLWRRNIKKAAKLGVEVSLGTAAELPAFHELYLHTAGRDHFTPRPLSYFEKMFAALDDPGADTEIRLYLAHHEADLVASTIWIRSGSHVWYSYGASSTEKREVRGSNAIQWRMIQDAIGCGAGLYDLRGITETLDTADPHVGLIQFKVGTGGEAVEYVGEWDLPLRTLLYKGFQLYMNRR
jgi:lipid II:glycine glycyltransferase (peptidoglycan interpeptide bridge formation enzyme)